ncbi:hypothetical protein LSAT2_005274 [Lamellibrachia satsuma]|nr:hypothetical protein LSAT2_005274 [Lamellibrachia satsuma]
MIAFRFHLPNRRRCGGRSYLLLVNVQRSVQKTCAKFGQCCVDRAVSSGWGGCVDRFGRLVLQDPTVRPSDVLSVYEIN